MHPAAGRRILVALTALICGALVISGCSTGDDAVVQGQGNQIVAPGGKTVITYAAKDRKPIGNVSGPDLLTGQTIDLDSYRGKVVVVNVWASWCPPCRKEATDLEQVFTQTQAKGVQFVGINFRDDKGSAQDFVRDRGLTYPSIYDYGGRSLAALRVPVGAVPTTVVLDRRLRPAVVYLKSVGPDELRDAIDRVLAEEQPAQ
ncbi:TlpA family protein disulfide reductase [Gordonia sp. PP30]|uniref:TlpA family protein disulfide reductase n=1 Tax=unclassified Gordonia (in: high G+C Gram-positive bacteria) TaxID=2657482 RepID=UPI001FFFEEBA|nr:MULTISPECIES: TlpA disulfide reductase family protein [unclassified Gordonia (in: high G+C Gram-positive bacteria)]UQE77127.1 TlpA family protein disulfide reductase [Gordonia sp. PP30]